MTSDPFSISVESMAAPTESIVANGGDAGLDLQNSSQYQPLVPGSQHMDLDGMDFSSFLNDTAEPTFPSWNVALPSVTEAADEISVGEADSDAATAFLTQLFAGCMGEQSY